MIQRLSRICLLSVLAWGALAAPSTGQSAPEQVHYLNPRDGTELAAWLSLPEGPGPHPAVLLLSVAGTDPFVHRLTREGYAVLTPSLRGFVQVEPLLRASYEDLAGDVAAGLAYLRALAVVDGARLFLVAQGDNSPQAMIHAAGAEPGVPLVLLAPPAFPGIEAFRLEQGWIAENQGATPDDLEALDDYVREIGEIATGVTDPFRRRVELERLRSRSAVELPRNAAFPMDEGQMRFLASRIWHDRLGFRPEEAMAALTSPVMVLIGMEDANTPMDRYLEAVARGLDAAPTREAIVCRVPGRTRHAFPDLALDAILQWLSAVDEGGVRGGRAVPPPSCLPDDAPTGAISP